MKRYILGILVLLLILGAGWRFGRHEKSSMSGDEVPSSAVDSQQTKVAIPRSIETLPTSPGDDHLDDADKKVWFETPAHESDGSFSQARVPIEWNADCRERGMGGGGMDFAGLVKARMDVIALKPFPRDVGFDEIDQFWTEGGEFHQMTAVTAITDPPTYRMEYYVSPVADFSRDVKTLPVVGITTPRTAVDSDTALRTISDALKNAIGRGAREGARILVVSMAGERDDDEPRSVRFVNGLPTDFTDGDTQCDYKPDRRVALCRCPGGAP